MLLAHTAPKQCLAEIEFDVRCHAAHSWFNQQKLELYIYLPKTEPTAMSPEI